MKLFDGRPPNDNAIALEAAMTFADGGGQALHVWDPDQYGRDSWNAPGVFIRSRWWAHLFDNDKIRLRATVRKLGVNVVVIGREGRRGQHVDLCGGPLSRAIKECNE